MNAAMLLSRLEGVRRSGDGWRANCPNGHAKARGSLSVTEADDGRILLSCFACHDTPAILGTLGLELADLFPERIRDPSPEARQRARDAVKRSAWSAALGVLGREAGVVLLAARDMLAGKALPPGDVERLALAEDRIARAREVLA
ncbi:hypothetical protein [Rhodanobacter geophilus]|uniref:DNA primase n=1 Tax=Rhodanobacter geophilus TaxID=3162488 RepID=A0ABV3QPZ8_9GAMM